MIDESAVCPGATEEVCIPVLERVAARYEMVVAAGGTAYQA